MTRTSRVVLLIAAASLSLLSACSESATGPTEMQVRRDATADSSISLTCRETLPWGKAR